MVNFPHAVSHSFEGVWILRENQSFALLERTCRDRFVQDIAKSELVQESRNGKLLLENGEGVKEFRRGELLLKLASLNPDVLRSLKYYYTITLATYLSFLSSTESDDTITSKVADFYERDSDYIMDRLDDAYSTLTSEVVLANPFEYFGDFSQCELNLVIDVIMSELHRIYSVKFPHELEDADNFIPRIIRDQKFRESIKRLLCDPNSCSEDEKNELLSARICFSPWLYHGELCEIYNVKSFDDLVALETYEILRRPSDYRKPVACEVCGRLFYKSRGQRDNICSYKRKDDKVCSDIAKDEYETYRQRVYKNLKSNLSHYGIVPTTYYSKYNSSVDSILPAYKRNNDLDGFKKAVDSIYADIRKETSSFHLKNKEFEDEDIEEDC